VLHEFLTDHRSALIARCRAKVGKRRAPRPTEAELEHGIPQFLQQLITALRQEESGPAANTDPLASPAASDIGRTATKHGNELALSGFTVDQVVHDYGDLCQAVTELAIETQAPVTTDEFRTLNRCLDNAIADAVTEFNSEREHRLADEEARANNERLGELAHELRNSLNTATLAIAAIKSGRVGFAGATGAVLDRSMNALRDLIDRSLASVRLAAGIPVPRERIALAEFIEEVQVAAAMEANARDLELTVAPVDGSLAIVADRQLLAAAMSNLLSNALKFCKPHGHVSLRAHSHADRVLIEVEDECGGLPADKIEHLFRPFDQQSADRSGIGLGLIISRRGVEASGGTLSARNAGQGCIFTVDLPRTAGAR
jgi:signal transduction histidine kinase